MEQFLRLSFLYQTGSTSNHYPLLLNPNGGNVGGTTSLVKN